MKPKLIDAAVTRISPTAHYTGYVWCRNRFAPPALATAAGKLFYRTFQPLDRITARISGGLSLESTLVQRHRILDHLLEREIEAGRVSQVIEIGSGLSPRGMSFVERFADRGLIYIEGDLPSIAQRKRKLLRRLGHKVPKGLHVVSINALIDEGPESLEGVADELLSRDKGTAIVTEGLLFYFDREAVDGMLARFAGFLGRFPNGLFLADIFLKNETMMHIPARLFQPSLEAFIRRKTHHPYFDENEATTALAAAGFKSAELHRPRDFRELLKLPGTAQTDVVRLIEAHRNG